jgi:hypothetical protein
MIKQMRNIKIISIRSIRDKVSVVEALLLLVGVAVGELDELFTIWVHFWIVLVTTFVINAIFDVCPPYIQKYTSEGPEKATRGAVNESQSKFLTESWPMSQIQPDAPLF